MRRLQGFWGLLAAYWVSDRWAEAWALTAAVLALTTVLSKASVWVATASGDFIGALAGYHSPDLGVDPAALLLTSALAFLALHVGRAGGVACRPYDGRCACGNPGIYRDIIYGNWTCACCAPDDIPF